MSITVRRQLTLSKHYARFAIYHVTCTPDLLLQVFYLFDIEHIVTFLDDLTREEFVQLANHVNASPNFPNNIIFDIDAQAFLTTPKVTYDILTWAIKKYGDPPFEGWSFISTLPGFSLQDYTQQNDTKFSFIRHRMSNIIIYAEIDENTIWIDLDPNVYPPTDALRKLKTFFKR